MQNISFLPLFDGPNGIGEMTCFPRRVVMLNGNSLLTGTENRVILKPGSHSVVLGRYSCAERPKRQMTPTPSFCLIRIFLKMHCFILSVLSSHPHGDCIFGH